MKLAPVLLALATGMFYLNGVAYRQGYLAHFHLQSTMFDDDAGHQMAFAVRGWQELVGQVLDGAGFVVVHWLIPIAAIALVTCWVLWQAERWRRARRRAARPPGLVVSAEHRRAVLARREKRARPHPLRNTPLTRGLVLMVLFSFLGLSVLVTAIDGIGAVLGICVWPFSYAGDALAAREQAMGFVNAPSVTVATPEGAKVEFRLITCGARYCALFRPEEVVTVPASLVTWLTNETRANPAGKPPQGPQPQQPQNPQAKSTS